MVHLEAIFVCFLEEESIFYAQVYLYFVYMHTNN